MDRHWLGYQDPEVGFSSQCDRGWQRVLKITIDDAIYWLGAPTIAKQTKRIKISPPRQAPGLHAASARLQLQITWYGYM